MRGLRASGHVILLVEQNLAPAMSVADTVHVVSSGRPVFGGAPAELSRDSSVLDHHLGVSV